MQSRPRVMVLANYIRPEHEASLQPYRKVGRTASSWNTALFAELCKLDVELHIVQFYPIHRACTIREGDVTYYYLPRLPKIDGITSIFKRVRAARLARRLRPDLIHGIGSEHGYAWAAVHHGWPSLVTIHGYLRAILRLPGHRNPIKRLLLEREERKALQGATAVIAINGYMKERFIADGCSGAKITVVPNALNPLYMAGCDLGPRDIDIVMVGTLHPLKNQDVALEILAQASRLGAPRPRVVVVGGATVDSTAYQQRLVRLKEEARLDNVSFVGVLNPTELKSIYCRSRFLLHLSAFEADPMVLAEARACGTVPIVNPVAGLAHRVRHGVNGYYLNINDREAAGSELIRFLADVETAWVMAQQGRTEIGERAPAAVAQQTLATYRAVIETVRRERTCRSRPSES